MTKAIKAILVILAHKVHKAFRDSKVILVQLELLAPLVHKD